MSYLEQRLYWAFEQSTSSVLCRQSFDEVHGTFGSDLYAAHHASAKLHYQIDLLPETQSLMLKAKYGLLPIGLNHAADCIQQQFRLPEEVAQGLVLAWLGHSARPRVWQLADMLDVSVSTVKRLTRKVFCFLDDLNRQALYALSDRVENRFDTKYNEIC